MDAPMTAEPSKWEEIVLHRVIETGFGKVQEFRKCWCDPDNLEEGYEHLRVVPVAALDAAREMGRKDEELRIVALMSDQTAEIARLQEQVAKVLEGFDRKIFVRNIEGDGASDWAVKCFPYLRALGILAESLPLVAIGGEAMTAEPSKWLAVDLYCGLGGWTEAFLSEGYDVIGFDNERHAYGQHRYPAQLILQDVLTLHGSQFKDATVIVASPPCQAYSYRAMPWKRAKALPPPDNTLFDACFRIQREASEAAGHKIPLIVENVCGAQKWVGRARWHYGSFYLWGDVPALMPITARLYREDRRIVLHAAPGRTCYQNVILPEVVRPKGQASSTAATASATRRGPASRAARRSTALAVIGSLPRGNSAGTKRSWPHGSKSPARKAASAMIAKIPFELARHIARSFK